MQPIDCNNYENKIKLISIMINIYKYIYLEYLFQG